MSGEIPQTGIWGRLGTVYEGDLQMTSDGFSYLF